MVEVTGLPVQLPAAVYWRLLKKRRGGGALDRMPRTHPFMSYALRPFFLLNGLVAIAVISSWFMKMHGTGLGNRTRFYQYLKARIKETRIVLEI